MCCWYPLSSVCTTLWARKPCNRDHVKWLCCVGILSLLRLILVYSSPFLGFLCMAFIILLEKVSLYFADCWVCALVDGYGMLILGGDEVDFADFDEGCVMLTGVWFIDTLGSDAGIYFVVFSCTLGFIAGLWVSSVPGVTLVVLGNYGGVFRCNSFTMSIIALVVLLPYARIGILFSGD